MSELDVLRELSGQFHRPDFDDLVAVSRRRRRRSVVGAAAGATVLLAAIGVAAVSLPDGQRALEPVNPAPTGSQSPSPPTEWTPERFRDEGTTSVVIPETESGLVATEYVACSGTCDGELSSRALEVAQGGRSAVFEIRGLDVSWSPVWVRVFDEDSVLVQDAAEVGRPEGPIRFRLLQADGSTVELDVVDVRVPAVPGPGVYVVDDYAAWSRGMAGPDDRKALYLVDAESRTVRPLDVPEGVADWGPNVGDFLWGTTGCRVFWQRADGGFDHHDVDCLSPGLADLPDDYWSYLGEWTRPGRLVLLEHDADGAPLVVHASRDRGATWERVEIGQRSWDGTLAQIGEAIAEALDELG